MEVIFSEKVLQFCNSKNYSTLVLSVDLYEEPCTQIYSPSVQSFTEYSPSESYQKVGEFKDKLVYMDKEFQQLFGNSPKLEFQLKGLLKKHIIVHNVQPIIRNVCKVSSK